MQCCSLALISLGLLEWPLLAQTTPSPPISPLPPTQDVLPPASTPLPEPSLPQPPPSSEDLLKTPTAPTLPPNISPTESSTTFEVKRYEVLGSTVFTAADFDQVTRNFLGPNITLAELFKARDAISQLYLSQGYITSGAYIPPQKSNDGVVTIQVVEGSLDNINVTGTKRLNNSYIRSRITRATHPPLNQKELLQSLELLQLDPRIKNLSAELAAGDRPGTNQLDIKVQEANTFQAALVLDNSKSPSIGTFSRGIQLSESNLSGHGDLIQAIYTNTDGSNALDLKYTWPLNASNATLSLNYGIGFNTVIEKPFNRLDINSQSDYYQLTLRQPVIQTPAQELALGLTFARTSSQADFFDGLLPYPSVGADSEGKTRIWALRFFQEWLKRDRNQVIALRSQFNVGLGLFDATLNPLGPDSQFFSWQGQGQWVRRLAPDTLFLMRTNLQLAPQGLVPLEQIGLGGLESVRGYRCDALLSDNGFFASAEARIPIARFRRIKGLLQLTPFIDAGVAWNANANNNLESNGLVGVGLGLRWQMSDYLTARLEWGIPLIPIQSSQRTWQENGLYFSIAFTPF